MKKVFLYAYDQINLGDDLFIYTIVKRYSNVKFYIWSNRSNKTIFKKLKNLKVIDKDSRFAKILKRIYASLLPRYKSWYEKRCDAVVYIGGSYVFNLEIFFFLWKTVAELWKQHREELKNG